MGPWSFERASEEKCYGKRTLERTSRASRAVWGGLWNVVWNLELGFAEETREGRELQKLHGSQKWPKAGREDHNILPVFVLAPLTHPAHTWRFRAPQMLCLSSLL